MELTNKRTCYDFNHEINDIKINGNIEFLENGLINYLNGNVEEQEMNSGYFTYSETQNNKINKSFNNISKNLDIDKIMNELLTEFRSYYSQE